MSWNMSIGGASIRKGGASSERTQAAIKQAVKCHAGRFEKLQARSHVSSCAGGMLQSMQRRTLPRRIISGSGRCGVQNPPEQLPVLPMQWRIWTHAAASARMQGATYAYSHYKVTR